VAFGATVGCPAAPVNSGWALRVTGMPPGLRRMMLIVWRGPYYEAHFRTYLVKP